MKDLFGYEPLRSLSIRQPYASAILAGKAETRTWNTEYRGMVLICTSKNPYPRTTAISISGDKHFVRMCQVIKASGSAMETLDLDGYAIAVGELYSSMPMRPEDEDKAFVNYQKGLYCHFYRDVRRIKPLPWKGSLGLVEVPDDIRRSIVIL